MFINQQKMKKDINLYKQGENLIVYINELPKNNEYWVYEMPVGTLDGEMCKNKLPLSWFEKLHDKDCYKTVIASSQKIEDIPQISKSDEAEWNRRDCPKNAKALCEEHFTKDGTYHLELSPDGCIIIDWGDAQPNKKEELRTEFATETKIKFNAEWVAYNDYVEWLEQKLINLSAISPVEESQPTDTLEEKAKEIIIKAIEFGIHKFYPHSKASASDINKFHKELNKK
jgi:hypothetical protein